MEPNTTRSYATFPVVLGGATAAAWALLDRVDGVFVVGVVGLATVVVVAALERIDPYLADYNRARRDVRTDLVHNLVSGIAIPELLRVTSFGLLAGWGQSLARQLGFGLWPARWPLLAELALALVVAELPSYWFHRLEHGVPLLWRVHATHHSAPRLYWLNAGRFHPVDALLSYALLMFPLVLLGAPERIIVLFTVFVTAHGLLQHSNIALRHGPLSWIFSTAELHRWHHAPNPAEGNHNYGTVLALWDVVFGTRYLPEGKRPPPEVGLADMPRFPESYLAQVASPLSWRHIGGGPLGSSRDA